jgi:hypothetical protein
MVYGNVKIQLPCLQIIVVDSYLLYLKTVCWRRYIDWTDLNSKDGRSALSQSDIPRVGFKAGPKYLLGCRSEE